MIDQMGGNLHHAPGVTGRAGPACLAREGDQEVLAAVRAARPGKTSGQDSAVEVAIYYIFYINLCEIIYIIT